MAEVLRELRATALEPALSWHPRARVAGAARRCSRAWRTGWHRPTATRCCASSARRNRRRWRRWWRSAADSGCITRCRDWANTVTHRDPAVRLASVQSLAQLGTPARARADGQGDRGRRPRASASPRCGWSGSRGYKGALKRVEAVVLGKSLKEMDLTEKMAFFEAYGAIAGRRRPQGAERHAAAARAAQAEGVVRDPRLRRDRASARSARRRRARCCTQVADDKDLVVRNAVNRALREGAT